MKVFKETQKFNQWWFYALEGIVFLVILLSYYKEYNNIQNESSNKSIGVLIFSIVVVLISFYFINNIKLKSKINEHGIFYQFFPIHLKYKQVSWSELSKCYVRKYAPIKEYGGWGFRGFSRKGFLGFKGNGMAFNIKGNMGIQLEFKDGGKLLIGTQYPEKAKHTINSYMDKMNNNFIA